MLFDYDFAVTQMGYIAGTDDGIVTAGGMPASRKIYVLDVDNLAWVQTAKSLATGQYLIVNLNSSKKYLVMVRDLAPIGNEQMAEPFCWDYVIPATDLTVAEQMKLWETWQDLGG